MSVTLPTFTPLEDSLFLTLYARAADNRRPHPILGDAMADQIVRTADYDFGQLHIDTNLILSVALRAKKLDQVASEFLARHPDAVGLDLGAGLDTRYERLAPPATVDWYDVDFPAVAAARQRLIPEHPNAHVIGADVTEDPDWLDTVPSGRPAIIVADGLMAFLSQDELVSLWNRLISHFPSGEIVFNSYTRVRHLDRPPRPRHQDGHRPGQVPRHGRRPRTRRLEPQAAAGQGDPAQPGTRGRRVPTGLAHVPPAGGAQHRLVPDGNHRPALPLLKSFAVAHPVPPDIRLLDGPASRTRWPGRATGAAAAPSRTSAEVTTP